MHASSWSRNLSRSFSGVELKRLSILFPALFCSRFKTGVRCLGDLARASATLRIPVSVCWVVVRAVFVVKGCLGPCFLTRNISLGDPAALVRRKFGKPRDLAHGHFTFISQFLELFCERHDERFIP